MNNHRHNRKPEKQKAAKGLKARKVDDYLRFMIFLAVIGMAYIWNSHLAERQIKEMEEIQVSVKDLKSRYLLKESMLSAGTRFSEIKSMVDTLGLRKMDQPAFRIIKGAEVPAIKTTNKVQPNTGQQTMNP